MNFRALLSKRIHLDEARTFIKVAQESETHQKELFSLLFDANEKMAYQAGWLLSHWPRETDEWLIEKQDQLIDALLSCKQDGKRRVILTILYRQPLLELNRVDFLDYCLTCFLSNKEAIAIRSLCMKIAYELCRSMPELLQEFKSALELIEEGAPPAITGARKNILNAIRDAKSLQPQVRLSS